MAPCSPYLLRPLRTFRQACRDIAASHPELIPPECDAEIDFGISENVGKACPGSRTLR